MNIRLWGLEEECRAAIEALRKVFVVAGVDGPYANREGSKLVRYLVRTRGLRLWPGASSSSSSISGMTLPRKSSTRCT